MKIIIATIIFALVSVVSFAQETPKPDDLSAWPWQEYNRQQERRRQTDRDNYQQWYMNESLRLQRQQNEILQQQQNNWYWDGFSWRKR